MTTNKRMVVDVQRHIMDYEEKPITMELVARELGYASGNAIRAQMLNPALSLKLIGRVAIWCLDNNLNPREFLKDITMEEMR